MSLINPRNLDNSVKPAKTVKYLFICMTKRIHFYLVCKKKKAFKKAKVKIDLEYMPYLIAQPGVVHCEKAKEILVDSHSLSHDVP